MVGVEGRRGYADTAGPLAGMGLSERGSRGHNKQAEALTASPRFADVKGGDTKQATCGGVSCCLTSQGRTVHHWHAMGMSYRC